ncbi:MAG: KH domain-containing protein [Prochlorothrix sp.]|nr:KH domain-containing protein [Prochlorothrix sp.]
MAPLSTIGTTNIQPDYIALVRFLLEPLVDSPSSLKVDCEILGQGSRVFIRVAFDEEDKGKALGRGGRNLKAVQSVVRAVGQLAHQTVNIDVFGGHGGEGDRLDHRFDRGDGGGSFRRSRTRSGPRSGPPSPGPSFPRSRPRRPHS